MSKSCHPSAKLRYLSNHIFSQTPHRTRSLAFCPKTNNRKVHSRPLKKTSVTSACVGSQITHQNKSAFKATHTQHWFFISGGCVFGAGGKHHYPANSARLASKFHDDTCTSWRLALCYCAVKNRRVTGKRCAWRASTSSGRANLIILYTHVV
jgi:hypothetical protein